MGCGLWPGLDRGKKGSGPILSNFFGWFFQFLMGKKKKFEFFLHFSVRTEKLHKIKLKFFKKIFGKKFYFRKTSFFRAKNAIVSTGRSGTDYCWLYCEL